MRPIRFARPALGAAICSIFSTGTLAACDGASSPSPSATVGASDGGGSGSSISFHSDADSPSSTQQDATAGGVNGSDAAPEPEVDASGDASVLVVDADTIPDSGNIETGLLDAKPPSHPVPDAAIASGPALAFPGATGFGATATGGRGGSVVHVTTLADSGPGSFRDAVSSGHRVIVFDVGGTITLSSTVSAQSNLTIAGQTAPGDGVAIIGREVSFANTTNDVVRYVRFRQGTLDPDSSKSGINLLNAARMIFDHVSVQFAQWNNIDSVGASNITVQHSISANPIGQQFAAHTETGPYTWYGNLFANAHNRCPLAKANTQYVNNVVYNYQLGYTAGNTAGKFSHDLVGNYFIAGPSTTSPGDALFQVDNQPIYNKDNLLDANANGKLDGVALATPSAAQSTTAPWSAATATISAASASDAYADVIAHAGASLHRDPVDTLLVADVTSLGAAGHLWTTQSATGLDNGGYGTLSGGVAPVDTDHDGMPDAWEVRYGLNPNSPADATGDFDGTGYTNIEKYIDGLVDGSYP